MILTSCLFLVTLLPSLALAADYVVIGGGTGGLTVASRLAEDRSITVTVLEAGPNAENLPEVFIPGLIGTGQSFTTLNWAYQTVPQVNLNNRQLTVNAGKALGGSTIINSMIFPRGAKVQYDSWGQLNNDSSWTWNALLPFFKRAEIFTPPNNFQLKDGGVRFSTGVHGFGPIGRVKVGFPNFFFPQSALWRKASGFRLSDDLADGNVVSEVGVAPNSIDANNNTRCSATCAYYTPFKDQPNFTVITNATATRIIWKENSQPLQASAVEYLVNGRMLLINVTKEVILAAGTIGTPKVLELSGVGNSTILKAAGVALIKELPSVGENLGDHVHSWTNSFTNITLTKDALLLNPEFMDQQRALWFKNRTGLLSNVPRSLSIAPPSSIFVKETLSDLLKYSQTKLVQFARQFSNGNAQLQKGIEAQHKIALELYQSDQQGVLEMNLEPGYSGPTAFADRPRRNYTTINAVLYAPLSRGRTHITSSNPLTPPAVDPAYWAHPLDAAAHVAGIQLGRRMLKFPPLNSIYQGEFEPGADRVTDSDVEAWARAVVTSDNHEVGTMAMMPRELGGVVDTKLRIYGIDNVRVVDASIIPLPISAHLSSTIYMIGEKVRAFSHLALL
ncbi:alcohol oxidase [Crucibulum laeve]|uniref:pyranose dehydrogenase (acceptor) n=1 Tax=Crucibulum laeve TaxID=68775 RepID=A0A5C3LJI5_9AGAR|nr:alcohol oxidase [Crucibulum laeve]